MTAYETNIYRHMKEDYERYSKYLEIAEEQHNTKVILFLRKYLISLEKNIKSYE